MHVSTVPASGLPLHVLVPRPRKLPLQVHFAGHPHPPPRRTRAPPLPTLLPEREQFSTLRPLLGLYTALRVTVRNDLMCLSGASLLLRGPALSVLLTAHTPDTVHQRCLTSPGARVFHCNPFGDLEKKGCLARKDSDTPRPHTLKYSPSVSSKNNPTGMR